MALWDVHYISFRLTQTSFFDTLHCVFQSILFFLGGGGGGQQTECQSRPQSSSLSRMSEREMSSGDPETLKQSVFSLVFVKNNEKCF